MHTMSTLIHSHGSILHHGASHKTILTNLARTLRLAPPSYYGSIGLWYNICHYSSPWYELSTLIQQTSRICPWDYVITEPNMWDLLKVPCAVLLQKLAIFEACQSFSWPFLLSAHPPSWMSHKVWKKAYYIFQIRWELN